MQDDLTGARRSRRFWILAWILSLLVVVGLLMALLGSVENTLQNNGRWLVTKAMAKIVLMGAQSYSKGTQALAEGRLDLGAWHGFQEVVFKQKLIPES